MCYGRAFDIMGVDPVRFLVFGLGTSFCLAYSEGDGAEHKA